VASHTITAVYSGDSNFGTSTSLPVTQTVSASGSDNVEVWDNLGIVWDTGNLNSSSIYQEGGAIPYRVSFLNQCAGSSWSIVIQYDFSNSGKHLYDFLTSYDFSECTLNSAV